MAKMVRIYSTGGPEVLRLEEVPTPCPEPGELRLRISAFAVNRADLLFRAGFFGQPRGFPVGLGTEAAGIVDMVGADVTGFRVGDRVSVVPGFSSIPGFGSATYCLHGEQAIVPAKMAVHLPPGLSMTEGASIWMQYTTAYCGLRDIACLREGDFVVITAASSSVAIAAIQIANDVGAVPIATTRRAGKTAALLELGAHHVIVTDRQSIAAEVHNITEGVGARVIFDAVAGQEIAELMNAAAPRGVIVIYGAMAATATTVPLLSAFAKGLSLRFFSQFELSLDDARRAAMVNYVLDGLTRKVLSHVIARTFALTEIAQAHQFMECNDYVGKIVVTADHRQ